MTDEPARRAVQVELQLRLTYPSGPGTLAQILRILRQTGGALHAHLIYRLHEKSVGLFVCAKPAEAALALEKEGLTVETETVVTVRSENRVGFLSHLVTTLEAEKIDIGYSYASASSDDVLTVFLTNDNPKAEDILRNYLFHEDPHEPGQQT